MVTMNYGRLLGRNALVLLLLSLTSAAQAQGYTVPRPVGPVYQHAPIEIPPIPPEPSPYLEPLFPGRGNHIVVPDLPSEPQPYPLECKDYGLPKPIGVRCRVLLNAPP